MKSKAKKFHLIVLGCQMNRADAERIEKILFDLNWLKTENEAEADLIAIVACSVRQTAIDRVYGKAALWRQRRQKGSLRTLLTGCVLDHDRKKLSKIFDYVISIKEIGKLPKLLGEGRIKQEENYFCLPAQRESNFSAFVPISNGCDNFCSYCAVPYTRGREVSRSAESIIKECRQLVADGYKEIILLGQNVNSYRSGSYDFPKLLKKIDSLKGDFWLRFLTSHPKDLSDDLIEAMASGKHITPYLHLALQSGDDEVLRRMNRHYTFRHYEILIAKARKRIPDLAVSTDLIVGFPGETKAQFRHTLMAMKKISFDMAYLSQYSPRPQTVASKLDDNVPKLEKGERWNQLNETLKASALKINRRIEGRVERVLVDGFSKGRCFGKTANYKIVSFPGNADLIGKFVAIKITRAGSWDLSGEML